MVCLMKPKKTKKQNSLFTGMIVGGAVGSVLSLLFSSKQNRESAKNTSVKLYKKGKNLMEDFIDKYKKDDE